MLAMVKPPEVLVPLPLLPVTLLPPLTLLLARSLREVVELPPLMP